MTMGIAFPKWLIDPKNNALVLFFYFCICIGMVIVFWPSQRKSADQILNTTMGKIYMELRENVTAKGNILPLYFLLFLFFKLTILHWFFHGMIALIELVSKSDEFLTNIPFDKSESAELKKIADEVSNALGADKDKFDSKRKVYNLLPSSFYPTFFNECINVSCIEIVFRSPHSKVQLSIRSISSYTPISRASSWTILNCWRSKSTS
jgi:hypothetical protein